MASRYARDLTPRMQKKLAAFEAAMSSANIPFSVTCTARSQQEQISLFAQGREALATTNRLRKIAGLTPITEKENARKVTWTLDSKHITGEKRAFSEAFDIVILSGGRASWDLKTDINENEVPDYEEAGKIGESVGLRWGGRFSCPDRPHYEDNGKD